MNVTVVHKLDLPWIRQNNLGFIYTYALTVINPQKQFTSGQWKGRNHKDQKYLCAKAKLLS